jgi:putative cardiolipin synthase
MHNKSFTADNLATIVGGPQCRRRVLRCRSGLSVRRSRRARDRAHRRRGVARLRPLLASDSSYPVESIVPAIDPSAAADLARAAAQLEQRSRASTTARRSTRRRSSRDLIARRLPIEWANVRLVSDDPAKGLGEAGADGLLWSQLMKATRDPERSLKLISPYFVPGEDGTRTSRRWHDAA